MNIFIAYLLVVLYKRLKKEEIDTFSLLKLVLLFVQVSFISLTVLVSDTGRFFYILAPMVIFQLVKEVQPMIGEKGGRLVKT